MACRTLIRKGGLDQADLPWTHEVDDAEKQNRFYVCCMSRLIASVEEAGMGDEKRRFEVDRTGKAVGNRSLSPVVVLNEDLFEVVA